MGLLGNNLPVAKEAARVMGKSEESADRDSFNRDFGTANFDTFGGDTQVGKQIEIGRFTVPASTEYAWGYGSADNPANQGYLYVKIMSDAGNQVHGKLTLVQESPTERGQTVVASFDTERLDASKSDSQLQVPLPEQISKPLVTQDSSLALYFNANTAETIDETATDVIFPVTEYDLSA